MAGISISMDKASKALDAKYMRIQEMSAKIEIQQQALAMLEGSRLEDSYIQEKIQCYRETIMAMKGELAKAKVEMVEDFLLLTDPALVDLLNKRYVSNMTWDKIAEQAGTTVRWVQLMRNNALHQIVKAKEETKNSL